MSGELSTGVVQSRRRRRGKANVKRHPWDWYVEQEWVTERLLDCAPIDHDVMALDPCCGQGSIVRALRGRGIAGFGMDMFDRGAPHFLGTHDFLGEQRALIEGSDALSIICNPPFSYQNGQIALGLAERFVRRALEIATHQVAALLPVKWFASQGRYRLFSELTPAGVWILCERPLMPPGDKIDELGDQAYARGKVDYMWVLWDKRRHPHVDDRGEPFAPTYWIPPRASAAQSEMSLAA